MLSDFKNLKMGPQGDQGEICAMNHIRLITLRLTFPHCILLHLVMSTIKWTNSLYGHKSYYTLKSDILRMTHTSEWPSFHTYIKSTAEIKQFKILKKSVIHSTSPDRKNESLNYSFLYIQKAAALMWIQITKRTKEAF